MQQHLALFVDLRRHIQRDAGEEGGQLHIGSLVGHSGRVGGDGGGGVGDVVLVGPHLDHRLLVVGRRHPRAGEGIHIPLGLEQVDCDVEVAVGDLEAGPTAQSTEDLVGSDGQLGRRCRTTAGDALVAIPAGGETAPVHPLLVTLVQGHLQDPRLQHHLTLQVAL